MGARQGSGGVATGALLVIAGAWLVLRTVRRPAGGRNLVDVILGSGPDTGPAPLASPTLPAAPARTRPTQAPRPNAKGQRVGGPAGP